MSVTFDEDQSGAFKSRTILKQTTTPKMVSFLIKIGLVKNEKTAENILLSLVVIFIILTIGIFVYISPSSPKYKTGEVPQIILDMKANADKANNH